MSESGIFKEAIDAIIQDHRSQARELLTRLLRNNKDNPEYWLWLSSVVDSEKEKLYCLQSVLRLDPDNEIAKRGLRLIRESDPTEEIIPIPPKRRSWKVELDDGVAPRGLKRIWANPIARLAIFSVAGIFVVGLIWLGIFGSRNGLFAPKLTITPLAWTNTPTVTPSDVALATVDAKLPAATAQPLWMQLEATYTPRPLYVSTPHPRSEAFRIALRAYESGDYESMLSFMEQVQRDEPEAADILYFLGEGQRLMGETRAALESYEAAIALDAAFAPAYLGRALAKVALNPVANVESDLLQAVKFGPDFGAAHLELAAYYLARGQADDALAVLEDVETLLADHPRFYALRAQTYLALARAEEALADAIRANELDITDLSVYLLLAEINFDNGHPEDALAYLQTFGLYEKGDARYWALLGRLYYELGENYEDALDAFDEALKLDDENALAYQYRGLTALELGAASQAMNDLYEARKYTSNTFEISLGFGRAMWMVDNAKDALPQMNAAEKLAVSERDFARLYYYRAQIAADLRELQRAELDWQALLELPEDVVPEEWRQDAELYLNPPTATLTITASQTPTPTSTPTPTLTITPGE
ncbi:MAG: tetratricopeptide repeat protein [Anaerolineae bacterium]|nr:tetratricopeptide repeat protein [Anaerolineae bacterium]MBL6965479.1 tetratricopeptide repeat protein [Anaerolineales bacterium]